MDHMQKNANQEKNWTTPNFFMVKGMFPIFFPTSRRVLIKPDFSFCSALNASISSGGYSSVVKTVYRMANKNIAAPIPKATFTDIGTTPGAASLLTPKELINKGRLDATHVLTPMIKVCTTKPKLR